jgi:hypothetical protein
MTKILLKKIKIRVKRIFVIKLVQEQFNIW